MLWLKQFDRLANIPSQKLVTHLRCSCKQDKNTESIAIIRPGGLGDLVVLTEACLLAGIHPDAFTWIVEPRNAIWLDYLGISYICYNKPLSLWKTLQGKQCFDVTIVSEQIHGLAILYANRVTSKNGKVVGFDRNPRADCLDVKVDYSPESTHEINSFQKLFESGIQQFPENYNANNLTLPEFEKIEGSFTVVGIGGLQVPEKKLGIEGWSKILYHAESFGQPVVILGHKRDREFAESLVKHCGRPVENLVGIISFAKVIDYLRSTE
ncbi:hypothetical protein BVY02_00935, partial [bacterium J17]